MTLPTISEAVADLERRLIYSDVAKNGFRDERDKLQRRVESLESCMSASAGTTTTAHLRSMARGLRDSGTMNASYMADQYDKAASMIERLEGIEAKLADAATAERARILSVLRHDPKMLDRYISIPAWLEAGAPDSSSLDVPKREGRRLVCAACGTDRTKELSAKWNWGCLDVGKSSVFGDNCNFVKDPPTGGKCWSNTATVELTPGGRS